MIIIEFYLQCNQLAKHLKEEALTNHHSDSAFGFKGVHDCYILPARNWKDVVLERGIVDSEKRHIQNSASYEGEYCGYTFDEDSTDIGDVCVSWLLFVLLWTCDYGCLSKGMVLRYRERT